MNLKRFSIYGLIVLTCVIAVAAIWRNWPALRSSAAPPQLAAGGSQEQPRTIPTFQLQDTDGRDVKLSDYHDKKAVVVVFLGTQCPLGKLSLLRLAELHHEFAPQGVQILAIDSNSQDAPEDIARHAKERQLPFPLLIDPEQKAADLFGATRTPEAFLLDGTRTVRYHGRIDDRYSVGGDRGEATRQDLAEALKELLAGQPVSVQQTPVVGCFIGRGKPTTPSIDVTYTKHVAAILQNNCQECHRPGQVAPFSLLTYGQAKAWAPTIREVVRDGRMPPWHADPKHGQFANDRSLPEADKQLLLAWIERGCPRGDDKDLPPPRLFPQGWAVGQPDRVLAMKEAFRIPAEAPKGGIPYQHFILDADFEQDVWLQAVEARPGNRAVVHHMLVFIGEPGIDRRMTGDRDVVVGYVPGGKPTIFPLGLGKRIPKGSKLVLEMHYTANGTEQTDVSSIGLIFAKEPPKFEVRSRFVLNREFVIPPRTADQEVTADTVFEKDAVVLSLTPHMHLRGKRFQFRAVYPDGRSEVLLAVPRYDFNWQHTYVLKQPLTVPAGTRIECVAHFDNSADNPNNPGPDQEVRWGDQSWEEMMLGAIGYFFPGDALRTGTSTPDTTP